MKIYRVTTSYGHHEFFSSEEAQNFISASEEPNLVISELDREPEPGAFEQFFTAEEWLALQGYSSIQLVALMDTENKLHGAEKTSAKLTAVRAWIDGILASFIQNPTSQSGWPSAPFTFEEAVQEAFSLLNP